MRTKQFNEEVLFRDEQIVKVDRRDIEFLKDRAGSNRRKRMRLCAHKDIKDALHEMLIVHARDTYVRPHKHLNKSESLYVIEGGAYAIIFDNAGKITDVILMGDYRSGRRFYYRISEPVYHALLITTDFFVFHETTGGPFNKSDTVFASWAPEENDTAKVKKFMRKLAGSLEDVTPGPLHK